MVCCWASLAVYNVPYPSLSCGLFTRFTYPFIPLTLTLFISHPPFSLIHSARPHPFNSNPQHDPSFGISRSFSFSSIDKKAFDEHKQTPHFAAWKKFADSSPFVAEPEIFSFELETAPKKKGPAQVDRLRSKEFYIYRKGVEDKAEMDRMRQMAEECNANLVVSECDVF